MYYHKNASHIKPKHRSRIVISTFEGINTTLAEELVPFKYSPKSYNYRMSGGILQHGLGLVKADFWDECVSEPRALFEYRRYDKLTGARDDRIIVVGMDGAVWQYKTATAVWQSLEGVEVAGKACAENYRLNGTDVLLLSSEESGLYVIDDDRAEKVGFSPKITSMCLHYDRIYCTVGGEKNAVWFSDDYNPFNWNVSLDEAGYIEFNDDLGAVNKVISFLDRIYVFRDYGINRLTAYNDQTNFAVSKLYLSTGRIIADTVAVCGSGIIFQSDCAVYLFDGLEVRRIMTNLEGLFEDGGAPVGLFDNGCYYLAAKLNFGETEADINNSLIEYRIYDGDTNIAYGFEVRQMSSINAGGLRLLLVADGCAAQLDNSGTLFGTPLSKLWTTPLTCLGLTDSIKILKDIIVNTRNDLIIEAELDGETHSYYIDGDTKYNKIKVNKQFDTIKLNVISETDTARISRIELIVEAR